MAFFCRRTGVPLNIKARKDSHGFDNIDDYFPDSGRVIFKYQIFYIIELKCIYSPIWYYFDKQYSCNIFILCIIPLKQIEG